MGCLKTPEGARKQATWEPGKCGGTVLGMFEVKKTSVVRAKWARAERADEFGG